LLTSSGFFNTILSPTRFGTTKTSLIDHIFLNLASPRIFSCTVDLEISDHLAVITSIQLPSRQHRNAFTRPGSKIDFSFIKKKIDHFDWSALYQCNCVHYSFKLFSEIIANFSNPKLQNIEIKTSYYNRFKKPWMSSKLFKLISKRSRLHKQSKREPFNTKLISQYRSFRNFVTNEITAAKTQFYTNEYEKCKTNINEKWKFINKF